MSLAELLPALRELPNHEKIRAIQVLAEDLASAEGSFHLEAGKSYPIWSPHNAYEAAEALRKMLEEGKDH